MKESLLSVASLLKITFTSIKGTDHTGWLYGFIWVFAARIRPVDFFLFIVFKYETFNNGIL